MKYCGQTLGSTYGAGIYTSPKPSYNVFMNTLICKSFMHAGFGGQAVLLCSVACGKTDMSSTNEALKPGHHSRVGQSTNVDPADNELVVFNERACIPRYLI